MFGSSKRILFIGLMMVLASAAAEYLKPTKRLAGEIPTINLEKLIPTQFGEWAMDQAQLEQIVDPRFQAEVKKIYGQTLSRSYLNRQGARVMLSMAYGGEQSKDLQVHLPEVCYAAQGFFVAKEEQDTLATDFGALPVKRLVATQGNRVEPITYWIVVGDEAAVGIKVKLARFRYGLTGTVPDGMLVRISSIGVNEKEAYLAQDEFVRVMLAAMSKEDRIRLVGQPKG